MPFVWTAGGAELSEDAKKSTINSAAAQQGVTFMADLIKDGLYESSELIGASQAPPVTPATAMGWEVDGGGLHELLVRLARDYPPR